MDNKNIEVEDYKVKSHTFLGMTTYNNPTDPSNTHSSYKYEITLNKSTCHTQRLWQGIERGLTLYEKWETTSNPIKKWIIGKVLGFK